MQSYIRKIILSLILVIAVFMLYLFVGPGKLNPVIFKYRLFRAMAAVAVGASLSLAGVMLQCLFRNPLAEPFILGVSSGATTGALTAIFIFHMFSPWKISFLSFLFAFLSVSVVFLLYRLAGQPSVETLLLSGIALAALLNALNSIVTLLFSRNPMVDLFFWLLGSLASVNPSGTIALVFVFLLVFLMSFFNSTRMDLLLWGEELAESLGGHAEITKVLLIFLSSLVTAMAVSLSGIIGFVGLISPHIARKLVGYRHIRLLPMAVITGAGVLLAADLVARNVMAPQEIPVGIISSIIGAPLFLALIFRRKKGF